MSRAGALARDRRGAAVVEFALIGGLALTLFTAVFEFAMLTFARQALDSAAERATRLAVTGHAPDAGGWVARAVERMTMGIVPADEITVTALSYQGFETVGAAEPFEDTDGDGVHDPAEPFTDTNGNGIWDNDSGADGTGESSDVVVYRLQHVWHALTPGIGALFEGTVLTATLTVQNEPF